MTDWTKVRILGRYTVDADGNLWPVTSAAEVSFRLTGATRLTLCLRSDDSVTDPGRTAIRPRFALDINGERITDRLMENTEETIAVPADRLAGSDLIRLVKLSECTQSLFALTALETDGEITPVPEKPLKIEFIGDSITCGYGVEGDLTRTFTTATENAEKAFAFLTARALNADVVMDSFSGHGVLSAYTEGDIDTEGLVPLFYEKIGSNAYVLPGGKTLQQISWDFSLFRPDYIVINLGTNDFSWTRGIPERVEAYERNYREFLTMVRRNNPDARILCVLGIMGTALNDAMVRAAGQWSRDNGDPEIRTLTVDEQDQERDGIGTDYHPSEITQRLLAEKVTTAIKEWMKV